MAAPLSPRNPGARVPKLGYRKALSDEEAAELEQQKQIAAQQAVLINNNVSRSTSTRGPTNTVAFSSNSAPKKKGSIFGGLFTKEPTISALAMVEADLKAKHGAATPQKVPHVSSRKMPEHVPKVNSKWDGVPEAVKRAEREEKQQRRISQRTSTATSRGIRSRDDTMLYSPYDRTTFTRGGSDTASQADSLGLQRRPSLYSNFSDESHEPRARTAPSVRSQSLRSPSGSSLPEITSFFPHHQHGRFALPEPTPDIPQRWQSVNSTNTRSTVSSENSRSDRSQRDPYNSSIEAIPEHSASPVTTPISEQPMTPRHISDSDGADGDYARPVQIRTIDGFLAGEAQPFEVKDENLNRPIQHDLPLRRFQQIRVNRVEPDIANRPDSSRERLGLRASMIVNTEAAPWEAQDAGSAAGSASTTSSSKTRFPKAKGLTLSKLR